MTQASVRREVAREIRTARTGKVNQFMEVALRLGADFLSCGGPVTRLENQLVEAGQRWGIETTVHATPAAITLHCRLSEGGKSFSRGVRILNFAVDLGRLRFVDKLLNCLANGERNPEQTIKRHQRGQLRSNEPSYFTHLLCVLGVGGGAALLSGASAEAGVVAAFFTVLVQLVVEALHRFFKVAAIFRDFLACFLAFLFSSLLADVISIPASLLSIGTLIYVVPGLLMTAAISEIVDQNYLSGTIRLFKAFYTFMSMALAFFLARDLARSINWDFEVTTRVFAAHSPSLATQLAAAGIIVFCSAIEFRADPRSLTKIMICGLSGALCFFMTNPQGYLVLSSFAAAFVIGLVSFWFGRRYKHPSQIYSVPSILILAPGMMAFSSFGYNKSTQTAADLSSNFMVGSVVQALLISLAIVFGLAAGRMPVEFTIRKS